MFGNNFGCIFFACAFCAVALEGAPLAFPEALGFGANASGGREGSVYHVTNLDDSGVGSFRDAVSKPNRIVVFDVSGYITLKTAVSISSNITIAGQTAMGEGIGLRGAKLSTGKQKNIIIRYLRIRPGSSTASLKDDGLNLYNARNVIVDHCSVEFAPWNNFGGSSDNWQTYPVTDVTIQNTLIANPIYQQFGAHIESINSNWSWYYNAFANTHNRNPLDKVNDVFVNNVHYDFEAGFTTHTSTNFKHDIVNNYFVYGPKGKNPWFQIDKNQSIYSSGNMLDDNRNGKLDGSLVNVYWYQGEGTVLKEPWNELTTKNPIYSAATAWRLVNSQSGVLPYDDIDSLVWSQMSSLGEHGQLYKSETETGLNDNGWGYILPGEKPLDSDNDGMPDFFENAMGYNVNKDDAMTKENDGYVRIEKYINWLGASHMRVMRNTEGDFDLKSITRGFLDASPTYSVSNAQNGTVSLLKDGHTAHFLPDANFKGLASFKYTVKGNDGTEYMGRVEVLVENSDVEVGTALVHIEGEVNQSVTVGKSIENIVYKFVGCYSATVEGLPEGVSFALNDNSITISGAPKVAGSFSYTLSTTGSDVKKISGIFNVRKIAMTAAVPNKFGSVLNAAYPADGIGSYEDLNENWIDSGYYNFNNSADSYGIWNFSSEKSLQNTALTLRYSSGSSKKEIRYMELFINNESFGVVSFAPTENWTIWDSVTVAVSLNKGVNMLKLISLDVNGGPNIDEFEFEAEGVTLYSKNINSEDLNDGEDDNCEVDNEDECVTESIYFATTAPLINAYGASFDFSKGTLFATKNGFATVLVYDLRGKLVAKFSGNVKAGVTQLGFKKANLPKARYETIINFK